jgi:hypothetical protein
MESRSAISRSELLFEGLSSVFINDLFRIDNLVHRNFLASLCFRLLLDGPLSLSVARVEGH